MGQRPSATSFASELSGEELGCLLTHLRAVPREGRCLEIGTAAGGTLCEMMRAFTDANRPQFVVVDPMNYFANQLGVVKENLQRHGLPAAGVDLRAARSADAFPLAAQVGETYDFIFIDGAHQIRYVTQDLRWTRLLKPGGLVLLHDYYQDRLKGVRLSAQRFLAQHSNYRREMLVGSLLVLRKTAPSSRMEINGWEELRATLISPVLQWERSLNKRLGRPA